MRNRSPRRPDLNQTASTKHGAVQYDWDGPLEREIVEWQRLYPNRELTLESVLAYSHRKHFLKLIGSDEYFNHASRTIAAARPIIQDVLSRPIAEQSVTLYEQFGRKLRPTDLILTFNYDTILEDILDSIGVPYSLTPEWWLDNTNRQRPDGRFPAEFVDILKLHGSIDWYDRRYYDEAQAYYKSQGIDVDDKDPLFGSKATIPLESLARGDISNGHGRELLSRIFRVPNHRKYFPFNSGSFTEVPFLLPPAFDKILGHDPIRELWSNMHRTMDAFSMITVIGYSMPPYDAYAYEALGDLIVEFQAGGDFNWFKQRRVPVQVITKAESKEAVVESIPFLDPNRTRIWIDGFNENSLQWIDWAV